MSISVDFLKRYCHKQSYDRGYRLFKQNKVQNFNIRTREDLGLTYVKAKVLGDSDAMYDVTGIYRESDHTIYEHTCTCLAYETYEGLCKHCVALFLEYFIRNEQAIEQVEVQGKTTPLVQGLINQYMLREKVSYLQPEITGTIEIEPTLVKQGEDYHIEAKIGGKTKYVIKNMDEFARAMEEGEEVTFGKNLTFFLDESAFTAKGKRIAGFLVTVVKQQRRRNMQMHGSAGIRGISYGKELRLLPDSLERFFKVMEEEEFLFTVGKGRSRLVRVVPQNPEIYVKAEAIEQGGVRISIPVGDPIWGEKRCFVRKDQVIYQCDKTFSRDMKPLLLLGKKEREVVLELYGQDIEAFCASVLPIVSKYCHIEEEGVNLSFYSPIEVDLKVFLEMNPDNEIVASLRAYYGEDSFDVGEGYKEVGVYRDLVKEGALLQVINTYFDRNSSLLEPFILKTGEEELYTFLHEGVTRLNEIATVYMDEKIRSLRVRKSPKFHIGITLGPRLLELKLITAEFPMREVEELLEHYRRRKKFYRMRNGDFISLEDSSLEAVNELFQGLREEEQSLADGVVLLPKYRALFVDQILKDHGATVEVQRNAAYKALIRDMKAVEDSDYPVPDCLSHILRNYQKIGYRWLATLDKLGFGGILADDMGLGKTLQVIALLEATREGLISKEIPTSFIVAPASLVYNWERELMNFAPQIKVGMVVGSLSERKKLLMEYEAYDVLVTSYDLLRRDIDLYDGMEFRYQIIDEAQAIKNPSTQIAKAAKKVVAHTKFALSGTPIENRLEELWSLFDYLMPGFLYSNKTFRKEIELSIVAKKDKDARKRLQQMIRPFILRRLKSEVLKELPEKEEIIVYTKLEKEQLMLYSAHVQKLKKRLAEQSPEDYKNSKIQTLAELTKLREICCDPRLLYENYRGGAAKVDTCIELVKNAIDAGHKVLLFSQFTSMLSILERAFHKEKIDFYKLTGQTSKEERMHLVSKFQKDETPLFMISLKAGGTGLNLTKASIVIHFDPWWNQAAENQATDRAHRIGQEKEVTVYKIIAKDTIEQNIQAMQQRKSDLANQIISREGVSITALTQQELLSLIEII